MATDPEELALMADPRFRDAVALFNQGQWYPCHDRFEELWHETQGSSRKVLQGILQIAVAHIHLERGNRRGATVLLGEGLGRLRGSGESHFGLNLNALRQCSGQWLATLQRDEDAAVLPPPVLHAAAGGDLADTIP